MKHRKETQGKMAAGIAVIIAILILSAALFVSIGGLKMLAEGLNDAIIQFEKDFTGEDNP